MNSEGSDAAKRRGAGSPRGETLIRRPTGGNDYVDGERTMLVIVTGLATCHVVQLLYTLTENK